MDMYGWKKWIDNMFFFLRNKLYMLFLGLAAAFSYGFLITHATVGIDDTPYAYYFEEGLNVIVGRWFLYLVNKVVHISDFSPFLTDLAGVLILMAAVVVWCSLLRSVCGDKAPMWGYLFFGCIFISSPLHSEVYTYYLHNGVSVGYLCTGIGLCFFRELCGSMGYMEDSEGAPRREAARLKLRAAAVLCGMTVFLWIALGCYESFMIVWLLGVLLVLLTGKYMGRQRKVMMPLVWAGAAAVAAILLRSAMIAALIAIFDLGDMRDEAVQRSVAEILSWMFEEGAFAEFGMAVKRFYVMYGAFLYAYYPIRIFMYSVLVMTVFAVWRGIRQRSAWLPVLTAGCFLACILLTVVECKATYYRSAQFLPVICGYGAFVLTYAVKGFRESRRLTGRAGTVLGGGANGLVILGLCVVLWNQCFDINRWFYIDWLKYEAARDTASKVMLELEREFDVSKPVMFTGKYEIPKAIIGDAYVGYGTETFFKIKRWTDPVDEHLLDKFYRDYGVWVAQAPELSVIEWGRYAFGDNSELVRFFAMHGYELVPYLRTKEETDAAEVYSKGLPRFPREGSIVDMGDYLIVHF